MEVNSTLRKITEYIEEKILVAVIELEFVCQTSTIVFVQKCTYAIFSLIDSRQIVTDTYKKRCFKFVWKPTESPLSATEINFFCEASLFNFHYPSFYYHLLTQKLFCLNRISP